MSRNRKASRLADRLQEIIELQRGNLSNREIGIILADREGREEHYDESSVRAGYARALSEAAKRMGLGE